MFIPITFGFTMQLPRISHYMCASIPVCGETNDLPPIHHSQDSAALRGTDHRRDIRSSYIGSRRCVLLSKTVAVEETGGL